MGNRAIRRLLLVRLCPRAPTFSSPRHSSIFPALFLGNPCRSYLPLSATLSLLSAPCFSVYFLSLPSVSGPAAHSAEDHAHSESYPGRNLLGRRVAASPRAGKKIVRFVAVQLPAEQHSHGTTMAATNKVPVTITFRRPGTQPPVFVAGSFSEPQWEPQEMTACALEGQDEYEFKAEIFAAPGSSIQYKFRLGHGDWWLLDEKAESVTDNEGNRNSLLTVPNETRPELEEAPTPESSPPAPASPPHDDMESAPEIRLLDDDVKGPVSGSFGDFETASGWLDPFSKKQKSPMGADWDDGQDRVPLFAHECLASTDEASNEGGSPPHSPSEARHSLGFEHEPDVLELQDPELEQFPSRMEQISELIHEVEDELEEDETTFEGVPPSAVLGVPRRATNDFVGDFIGGSPATSTSLPRSPQRLAVPRASMGSVASDVSSSVLSLQSIAEGGEEEDVEDPPLSPKPVVMLPSPVTRPTMAAKLPTSDDDEAVVLDRDSPKLMPAQTVPPVRPQDGENMSADPSPKGLSRDLSGQSQKAQVDGAGRDGEYQTSKERGGETDATSTSMPTEKKDKEAAGDHVRLSRGVRGGKEANRQTMLVVGSAVVALVGLAIWYKGGI